MQPVNYDGRYHGPILFRDALANSYNIPPIQLMRDIGISNFIATARNMGIESLQEPPGFYGLALTLGGGEVPLLEMTHAYATLANMGPTTAPHQRFANHRQPGQCAVRFASKIACRRPTPQSGHRLHHHRHFGR